MKYSSDIPSGGMKNPMSHAKAHASNGASHAGSGAPHQPALTIPSSLPKPTHSIPSSPSSSSDSNSSNDSPYHDPKHKHKNLSSFKYLGKSTDGDLRLFISSPSCATLTDTEELGRQHERRQWDQYTAACGGDGQVHGAFWGSGIERLEDVNGEGEARYESDGRVEDDGDGSCAMEWESRGGGGKVVGGGGG